jgi:hypothetical protein
MGRKRRNDLIEPGSYDPEDERAIREGQREQPSGPEWWEGRWPEDGISSLADLERWVDDNLDEMISLNRTHPQTIGGNFARNIGRQALRNATRYLDRNGRGDHPPQPIADQLEHIEQIEAALGALLRYIRREQGQGDEAVTPADATEGRPRTRAKAAAKRPSGDPPKRSWLQPDLDHAISKYKAKHAGAYQSLFRRIRAERKGAIEEAQEKFGRNAIARELGVRSSAMVSKSRAWQEIAEDLSLPRGSVAKSLGASNKSLGASKQVGLDIAIEKKAEDAGDVLDEVIENETIGLIKEFIPPDAADSVIQKFRNGTLDDDDVREMVTLYKNQSQDFENDNKGYRVRRRP